VASELKVKQPEITAAAAKRNNSLTTFALPLRERLFFGFFYTLGVFNAPIVSRP